MLLYAVRRAFQAIPIFLGVSLVVFVLLQLAPGNAVDVMLPPEASAEMIAQIKAAYNFDKPLYVQYLLWLCRMVSGDLGLSIFSGAPVREELATALANTLALALPAAAIGFSMGALIGFWAALRHGQWLDKALSAVAIAAVSVPHYWLAIVMVTIFSVLLNWLPAQGMGDGDSLMSLDGFQHMIMPVLTLSLVPMGIVARMVRATILDILSREFMESLHARGIRRWRILYHVAKNAAPPVLAIMGLQFGYLLGGSILVETVFNWPGSGNLMSLAIFRRDIPVLQAAILLLAFFFVTLNFLVDLAQAAIDPRIRR